MKPHFDTLNQNAIQTGISSVNGKISRLDLLGFNRVFMAAIMHLDNDLLGESTE